MSQPVRTTDSNSTINDITREDSVYLESTDRKAQKNSQQTIAPDDSFGQAEDTLTTNDLENGTTDANSRNKRREEKHSRWVAEQSTRVREKFDLSPSDNFVASFSAALLSTILLQGRMYITTHHLCFYTKLFGKVTKEAFSYSSLARVKKRRGGLVANAIKVYFTDEELPPVIIGSLNHREKAFSLIQERLRIVNPNAAEPLPEDDDGSTGSVASTPIETEEITAASARIISGNPPPLPVRQFESPAQSTHSDENAVAAPEINQQTASQLLRIEPNEVLQVNTSIPEEPPVQEIDEWERSLVWRTQKDIVGSPVANAFDKKAERARIVLKAPVKEVFNVLYISDWLKEYHQEVKNYDVEIGEWVKDDEGGMRRDVSFRRPIGYKFGPKETRVNEKQRYIYTDHGGVLVEVQGRNLDVPCSSYFVVESFFDMSPVNDGRHTLFVASVAVNFVKSTFLQGKIEGGTLTETKTAYGRLTGLAERKIDQHVANRAANKMTTNSIQMHPQELANGHVVDNGSSEPESQSQSIVNEAAEPESVSRVVQQAPMPTSEENRADHSYEVVSREPRSPPLHDASTNGIASNIVSTKVDTKTDPTAQHSDALHFYRKASIFLLVVACVLLLIVIILLIRVQGLLNSLEKVIDMLKDTGSDKQC